MAQDTWNQVDGYLRERFAPPDAVLEAGLAEAQAAGLPEIEVAPMAGSLLALLARAIGARTVLEIGTLAGYSATWLGRSLPPGGRMITLEADPRHAAVARKNLARAGLAEVVQVIEGPALESLPRLAAEGAGPFDLIFIDANKDGYPAYLEWALRLAQPGSLIVADNVVRDGSVADPQQDDAGIQGIRRFLDALAANPRLQTSVVQTVGPKGYDGISISLVR